MDKCQIDNCKLKIGEMNWASQWTDSLGFENWWQLADNVLSSFFFLVSYVYVFQDQDIQKEKEIQT